MLVYVTTAYTVAVLFTYPANLDIHHDCSFLRAVIRYIKHLVTYLHLFHAACCVSFAAYLVKTYSSRIDFITLALSEGLYMK
jgi:hypothetical protein